MDRKFVRYLLAASLAALPGMVVLVALYFRPGPDLLEQRGYYIGLDFVNYWTGGRLALTGSVGTLYDVAAYNALLREWFAPANVFMLFSYPPNALPLLALFAWPPYLVALPIWLALGTAAFFAVCLGRWPTREDALLVLAIALSPVLWVNLNFGQLGLFLAFLFVGALRLLPVRPVLAGVMIGLLTIKPQLGLLLALTLVVTGAWRAFAAATVTAVVLAGLSVALFGIDPWQAWFSETAKWQWLVLTQPAGSLLATNQTLTPFGGLRLLGASLDVAFAVQGLVAILVVLATWAVLKTQTSWPLKAAVVAFGSMLMVPYVLAYDLAIAAAALVWYLCESKPRASVLALTAVTFVWAVPFALVTILQDRGVPIAPVAVGLCYVWLLREALAARSPALDSGTVRMMASASR